MPRNAYELMALIPPSSGFRLEKAPAHFSSTHFRRLPLDCEPLRTGQEQSSSGFRVRFGDWAVVVWLDGSDGVQADSQELANESRLPARSNLIAACRKRLWIHSDEDPDLTHSDEITFFADELRTLLGLFVYDPVAGEWWI